MSAWSCIDGYLDYGFLVVAVCIAYHELLAVNQGRSLRWVDLSANDITDLHGAENMPCLEWLDLHSNNLKNVAGLNACPRLTFLNMFDSDLVNLISKVAFRC